MLIFHLCFINSLPWKQNFRSEQPFHIDSKIFGYIVSSTKVQWIYWKSREFIVKLLHNTKEYFFQIKFTYISKQFKISGYHYHHPSITITAAKQPVTDQVFIFYILNHSKDKKILKIRSLTLVSMFTKILLQCVLFRRIIRCMPQLWCRRRPRPLRPPLRTICYLYSPTLTIAKVFGQTP